MRKKFMAFVAITGIFLIFTSSRFATRQASTKESKVLVPEGVAVVELFTSEGCSSCPPADEIVTSLLAEKKKNVYILSYHVDYWDRLGWKDPFSMPGYSQRQYQYASVFNLNSVYTPQVVVNGSLQFVGSDKKNLTRLLKKNYWLHRRIKSVSLPAEKTI